MSSTDGIKWWPKVEVHKYSPETVARITSQLGHEPSGAELAALTGSPDDIAYAEGNQLVTVGLNRIGDLITGTGTPTAFTSTRGVAGVGNSTTAFSAGQTALVGASQFYGGIDAAPGSANGVLTANITFQSAEANFAWEEWCWAIATATPARSSSFTTATTSGVMLNRKVQSLGTKVAGAVWTLQATVTLS